MMNCAVWFYVNGMCWLIDAIIAHIFTWSAPILRLLHTSWELLNVQFTRKDMINRIFDATSLILGLIHGIYNKQNMLAWIIAEINPWEIIKSRQAPASTLAISVAALHKFKM